MRLRYVTLLTLASLAMGQAAPNATNPAVPKHPGRTSAAAQAGGESSVPPNAAVITVPGVCDAALADTKTMASSNKQGCKTIITRAQFEALANALQPNMNAQTKRRLADVYPRLLAMAQEARRRGLENDPKYKEVARFSRLQILSQQLSQSVKEEAEKVPEADIENYYKDNPEAFEQAALLRLFVPKEKQHAPAKADTAAKDSEEESPKGSEMQKADEEAMKRMAEEIQKRAAAGEDFDQLQREAYQAAGIGGSPAPTSIGKLTRSQIPIDQRKAVDLKVGEVSPLYTEPNGFYIYKVLSKEAKPLEEARDEIRTTLSQQRVKDAMAKYQQENTAILNEAYFAPASPPPPPRTGPGGPSAPGPAGNPQSRATPPSTNSKPASPQASQK